MPRKSDKILSALYELLRDNRAHDFLEAGRHSGTSKNLREALESLAIESDLIAERSQSGFNNSRKSEAIKDKSRGSRAANDRQKKTYLFSPSGLYPGISQSLYLKNLTNFLGDKKYFPDKSALQKLVSKTGLSVDFDAKSSRQRFARKIALEGAKSEDFKTKLFEMIEDDASKQTQGWLEIIRKRQ